MSTPETLRQRLSRKPILLAPGIFDALTASIAATAGFEALYLSGANIAYTRLGRPDIGLVSMSEVAQTLMLITERVDTPIVVDADTGYGNALNMERTVRLLERAGAAALQIEDQVLPKRCGHLADKAVVSTQEMVGKIHAAVDSRRNRETLIIARTDAIAVEGFASAIARAHAYAQAGADMLFIEAPRDRAQLVALVEGAGGTGLPLMANMVEGGHTPVLPASQLEAIGFAFVIFPGGIVRALARSAEAFYRTLARDGTTDACRDHMFDFDGLNRLLGTADILDRGKRYERGGR